MVEDFEEERGARGGYPHVSSISYGRTFRAPTFVPDACVCSMYLSVWFCEIRSHETCEISVKQTVMVAMFEVAKPKDLCQLSVV